MISVILRKVCVCQFFIYLSFVAHTRTPSTRSDKTPQEKERARERKSERKRDREDIRINRSALLTWKTTKET